MDIVMKVIIIIYLIFLFVSCSLFILSIILYCNRCKKNKNLPPEQRKSIGGYTAFLVTTCVFTVIFIAIPIFIYFLLLSAVSNM